MTVAKDFRFICNELIFHTGELRIRNFIFNMQTYLKIHYEACGK